MSTSPPRESSPRIDLRRLALRPVRPDDEPALLAIFASTREDERPAFGGADADWQAFVHQQFKFQHTQYQSAYAHPAFLLVLCDGEVAGRIYIDRGVDEIRLVDIALLTPFRRQGIARHLLQALCSESDVCGTPLGLHVEKNNPILAYYGRLGFEIQADRGVYLYMRRACRALPIPDTADFAAAQGTAFDLMRLDGVPLATLRLTAVQTGEAQGMHRCTLQFTGPDIGRPAHDTYLLSHPGLGQLPLFLGPITGGTAAEVCYQAIIARPQPTTRRNP